MKKVTAPNYSRIRVMWPDHLGLARGKYLSGKHASGGTGHSAALFALGFDRNMTPHKGACFYEGLPDIEVQFDMGSVRESWEVDTGLVVGDVRKDGAPVMMCPREVLKKAIADWGNLGLSAKVGIELEAFLLERGADGRWGPVDTPGAYVYGTGRAVDPGGVIEELARRADAVGLSLESTHSEYDNGQFELTLPYDDVLKACDDAFLFKVLAKEVALEKGYLLTFMGKPFSDRGGSGTHINLSLVRDGANVLYDQKAEDGMSESMRHCIGGLLNHHRGMAAVCAPTVNAYKRLRPGQMCGYWANWGHDHRGVAVRVPPARAVATRIEHRIADGATNPHIAAAATLQAARLGLVDKTSPPPPETEDCWENVSTDVSTARNLSDALDDLEADTSFVSALSPDYVDAFVAVKRAEWARYAAATTDWEINEYLHFL